MSVGFATTFPIDVKDCKVKHGRVELTGWHNQQRATGIHGALDIPCERGTAIKSVKNGKVIAKGYMYPRYVRGKWVDNYGNYLMIQDEDGFTWIYGHLETTEVNKGDRVREGQFIARAGSTGLVYSNGAPRIATHLHIEKQDQRGRKINISVELGRAVKSFIPDQWSNWAFTLRK